MPYSRSRVGGVFSTLQFMKSYSISAGFVFLGCSIARLTSSASNWYNETVFCGFNIMSPVLMVQVKVNPWDGFPTHSGEVRDKTGGISPPLRWKNLLIAKLDRNVRGTGSAVEDEMLSALPVTRQPLQFVPFSSIELKSKQQQPT